MDIAATVSRTATLTPGEIARIEASEGWRRNRIECFDTQEVGQVLVKGQRAPRHPARYRALNALAFLLGVRLLRAAPAHGGARSQGIAVRRLHELRAAGVPVPQVLHVAPEYFVMEWLDGALLSRLLDDRHPAGFDLWLATARAIARVHEAGQYLSQCYDRNIIVDPGSLTVVGFVDFEDDPLEVLTLAEAQARDWLLFLQSTLWHLQVAAERVDEAVRQLMESETDEVRRHFSFACRRLAWLRRLPQGRRLGRDAQTLQVAAAMAHRWTVQQQPRRSTGA